MALKMADSKPRILIVDDEENIVKALARHYKFLGYNVSCATNAEEALSLLASERTEVVISDIKMPGMDGLDLLKEIRSQYPMTRVIMITGYVTLDNLLSAFRRGADTCIFKPLNDLTELEVAVSRAVDQLKDWQCKLKQLKSLKGEDN